MDDVVAELKKEKADAFSGAQDHPPFTECIIGTMYVDEESVGLLEAMYKHQYFPKATILWVGPGI